MHELKKYITYATLINIYINLNFFNDKQKKYNYLG